MQRDYLRDCEAKDHEILDQDRGNQVYWRYYATSGINVY